MLRGRLINELVGERGEFSFGKGEWSVHGFWHDGQLECDDELGFSEGRLGGVGQEQPYPPLRTRRDVCDRESVPGDFGQPSGRVDRHSSNRGGVVALSRGGPALGSHQTHPSGVLSQCDGRPCPHPSISQAGQDTRRSSPSRHSSRWSQTPQCLPVSQHLSPRILSPFRHSLSLLQQRSRLSDRLHFGGLTCYHIKGQKDQETLGRLDEIDRRLCTSRHFCTLQLEFDHSFTSPKCPISSQIVTLYSPNTNTQPSTDQYHQVHFPNRFRQTSTIALSTKIKHLS